MGWGSSFFPLLIVTASGGFTGFFVYSPHPGHGNLIASTAAHAGTDPFGNAYLQGITTYSFTGGLSAVNLNAGAIQIFNAPSAAGPWTARTLLELYSPVSTGPWFQAVQQGGLAIGTAGGPVEFWLPPSGDLTGVTDSGNLAALFGIGVPITVHLLAATYYVNSTVVVPTGCSLIGAFPVQADNFSPVPGVLQPQGTIIDAIGAFTAGPVAGLAVVSCTNSTATQQGGQVLANFSIQGSSIAVGSGTFGILINGAVGAGVIQNVMVLRADGANLRIRQDPTSLILPDQWTIENCTFAASRSSHGVQADDIADSNFINCYSHDNKLDGYNIGASVNTQFLGCRGETNTGNAFHFTGLLAAGQRLTLTGCISELNAGSGYLFDATGPGGTALGTYILTGCSSWDDGTSGTTQGGFWSNGSKSRIMMTGCFSNVGGTQNAFGAYEGNVSFGMALTGCYMHGGTGATHDDGTNTNVLSNLVPVPF